MRWIFLALATFLWSCETDVRVAFEIDETDLDAEVAASVVNYDLMVFYGSFPDGEPLACELIDEFSAESPGLLVVHAERIEPDDVDETRYLILEEGNALYYVRAWDSGCRVVAEGCHREAILLGVRGFNPTVVLDEIAAPVSHCD